MISVQKLTLPEDRLERLHYIKRIFSHAHGSDLAPQWAGGRRNGLNKLNSIDALAYARNRQFINGAVTHLSPYLRHGCISLNETFASVKARFDLHAEKLLTEFARRDYWRQVWYAKGDAIYSEIEPPKVCIAYAPLTEAVLQAKTGLPCMDAFIQTLLNTGYLHHHARLWLASYIVHHLKCDWRQAADWFEARLLDGDIASNHLSWQWVASTYSSKPYFTNKDSIARFTGEKYCATCKAKCPFDGSAQHLVQHLFDKTLIPIARQYSVPAIAVKASSGHPALAVFIHDEMLSPTHDLLQQPFPKIFVFDPQIHGHWSLNRLQFLADCINEMHGVEVWLGDTYEVLMQRGVGQVITQDTPNKKIKAILTPFSPTWQRVAHLVNIEVSEKRFKRFSRYWEKVGPTVLNGFKNSKSSLSKR
ncbi:MAG: DNA photolyase [Methylotenera sp.]|nr:DNA photolyase [Methylotenera sp.]